MRADRAVIIATICLTGAAILFAQSVPPPPPPLLPVPSPQSAVHVTTRIVQVSVTVHGEKGQPVKGLTKNDFVLLDNGQRQQIASISEQSNRVTTNSTAVPNLFTNRFAEGTAQPALTVIVLDAYNTRYLDYRMPCPPPAPYTACFHTLDSIFSEVEKFISQMHPQDHVALYELADKLYLLQDFTSDPIALQRGLEQGREYAADIRFPPSEINAIDIGNYTLNAMHALSERLAKVPGRKNLIWLSTGFPPSKVITAEKMGATAKSLGDADLPLSAIDARGLVPLIYQSRVPGGGGRGMVNSADMTTPAERAGNYGLAAIAGQIPGLHRFDYTKELADMSGGRAFYDTNDFAGSIRRVIDDSADTYILGYYPNHNKWNGEFREIKVKVDRPGVEVHARKGYFAVAETKSAAALNAEKLDDAVRSPLESTDLGFDVQADGVEASGTRQLKVTITVDAAQLRFVQQGERWTDNISEVWAEFDPEGRQLGANLKTIDLKPTQEEYKQVLRDGLSFSETVPVADNAAEIRLALRDMGNGAIGSAIIPLTKLFPLNRTESPAKK